MANIVVSVDINLPSVPVPLLIVSALTLIKMRVRLSEDLPAKPINLACFRIELPICLVFILVHRFPILESGVDLIRRIFHDVYQPQRTEHMPCLPDNILNIILIWEINFISWLNFQHLNNLCWELLLKPPFFKPVVLDAPKIKFFSEKPLFIRVIELRVHFPVISQVVHQRLESFSISIQENAVIHFLDVMQPRKHFLKGRLWDRSQNFLRAHNFVRPSNVHIQNFRVKVILLTYKPFLMFPRILFGLNLIELSFELLLRSLILICNHIVVLLQSIVINFELLQFLVEHLLYFHHVVSERLFNLRDGLVELLLYL